MGNIVIRSFQIFKKEPLFSVGNIQGGTKHHNRVTGEFESSSCSVRLRVTLSISRKVPDHSSSWLELIFIFLNVTFQKSNIIISFYFFFFHTSKP